MQILHYPKRVNLLILLSILKTKVKMGNLQAEAVQETIVTFCTARWKALVVRLWRFEKVQNRFKFNELRRLFG
jgi:hypothetical protein